MVLRTNCWKQWTKTTRFSWQYVFKTWQADQTADSLNFKKSITLLLFLFSLFTSLPLCPILPECERRTCKVNCMIWSYLTSLPIFRWQCKETVVDSKFSGERLFPRRRADWVSSTNYALTETERPSYSRQHIWSYRPQTFDECLWWWWWWWWWWRWL